MTSWSRRSTDAGAFRRNLLQIAISYCNRLKVAVPTCHFAGERYKCSLYDDIRLVNYDPVRIRRNYRDERSAPSGEHASREILDAGSPCGFTRARALYKNGYTGKNSDMYIVPRSSHKLYRRVSKA